MVWNNPTILSTIITFVATSSTDFGVFVYVVGSLDSFTYDPNSFTILLPISNSNGNPFTYFSLLGGTCSFIGLNFSKVGCVATLFVYSLVACRPSYVYYCCYCTCCCKCFKCFGHVVVSIQSSHTSPSKYICSSPSRNLMSCSLFNSLTLLLELSFLWRHHMWYLLLLLPWLFFLWRCHLWHYRNLSNYLYHYRHYPYHCWHYRWFHSTLRHFLCLEICVFMFFLHS